MHFLDLILPKKYNVPMSTLTLYHGSEKIISLPGPGMGRNSKDFGAGFYCTADEELAGEWAVSINRSGFINKYEIEDEGLAVLDLTSSKFSLLNWLSVVISNRRFRIAEANFARAADFIIEKFHVDTDGYDIIRGIRADDSYFSFIMSFLASEISYEQFKYAMNLGRSGEQFAVKSKEAFDRLIFMSHKTADRDIYYPRRKTRDDNARIGLLAEVEIEPDGIYMLDILRDGIDEKLL